MEASPGSSRECAALLRDIGKTGIPDSILNKPGALNDEEKEIMQQHPAHAKEMLKNVKRLYTT